MSADPRRAEALQTAFGLFLRFGYRKTSMDDVARAVGLSRQGLYVWYPNKKALFAAVVEQATGRMLAQMRAALGTADPLEVRLLEAFTHLSGVHTDPNLDPSHVDELFEATKQQLGDHSERFLVEVHAVLADAVGPLATPEIPAEHIAEALLAASTGIKHEVRDREGYRAAMRRMIRVICG